MLAWASFTGGTEHTNPHPPKRRAGNYALIFFKEKAAVRTDAAPTNTNSTPKTQTTQTPPRPESSPSQGYPPNTFILQPAVQLPLLRFQLLNSSRRDPL